MKKKDKKEKVKEKDPLDKLMKLTKLMKDEKVTVAPKGLPRYTNKWRSNDPKFAPKPQKSAEVVQAGGMDVDPARKEEYENWRKDKMEEQAYHRAQAMRKAKAAAAERKALQEAFEDPPQTPEAPEKKT